MAKIKAKRGATAAPYKRPPSFAALYLILVLALGVFFFAINKYEITQDDAYISFRYAENFLRGDGLVYNVGERVEGYTNFLWVMIMALAKNLFGIAYPYTTRILGMACGAFIFYLLLLLTRQHLERHRTVLYASVSIALLANVSLAYWSISSLETAAFACLALAAVAAEYRKPQLTPALLVIASLLRPEGAVVFGIILVDRLISERRFPWYYFLLYVVPLLPFAAFKLVYFGSLFPNPYYAKSGVGLEYIISGFQYVWYFTKDLGLFGVVWLAPLLAIMRLWQRFSLLYLYIFIYTAYIIWVGGDVLYVYRFFVPVVPCCTFSLPPRSTNFSTLWS